MMTPLVLSPCRLDEYDSRRLPSFADVNLFRPDRKQSHCVSSTNPWVEPLLESFSPSLYLSPAPYFRFFLNITARLFLSHLSVFPSSRGNSAWPYTLLCGQVRGRGAGGGGRGAHSTGRQTTHFPPLSESEYKASKWLHSRGRQGRESEVGLFSLASGC